MKEELKHAIVKSGKFLWNILPLLVATMLLLSLVNTLVPASFYSKIFSSNPFLDSFVGGLIGSISAGNPMVSYIFGGELLEQGVSLIAVTAFIVSWVTVGTIQFPAEAMLLGKRFAVVRNILSFVFSMITAAVTVFIVNIIGRL
ncbi:hypothetical protein JXB31_03815 [Candidatus Woesearchaeota archaeon]|nr:hypothetical protein [Candidatus Woesearchaeota archaeon]